MATQPPPYPAAHGLLANKTVVVTAAAGTGIGFAVAQRCAEEGASLLISDIHDRRCTEAVERIREATGAEVTYQLCDVRSDADVRSLVDTAIERLGHIDVWINNAGLGGNAAIVDMTDDQWNAVVDITMTGTFRCLRAVLPHMYERNSGVIVNNASVLGWRAQELQSHYAAAKAGVMALTRCSAIEAAEHNVRINAVSPSLAMHAFLAKVTPDGLLEELESKEAFGRAAEPWEIANVMVMLASDYTTYMTGEVVSVSSQRA